MGQPEAREILKGNDRLIAETFRRFLIPTILALLGGTVCNLLDAILVGRFLGETGLAAMSLVTPIFFLYTTLGSLLGVGGATLATIRIGKEDMEGANRLFTLSLILVLCVGVAVSAVGVVALEPLLNLLGGSGAMRELARAYCLAYLPGAWTTMLLYIPLNFFRITGHPQVGARMFAIMAVGNVVFSLLLMLPLQMGMAGVALGTVLGTTAALLYSLRAFLDRACPLRLRRCGCELRTLPRLLLAGSPMALSNLLNVLRTLAFNRILLLLLGGGAVTVFAVLSNVNTFALAILSGVAQTLTPLTGVFFGERDTQSMRRVMFVALRFGLCLAVGFAALLIVFWKPLCLSFGLQDVALFAEARFALICFGLSLLPALPGTLLQFHYMAIQRAWIANLCSALRGFLLAVPLALLLGQAAPHGVWLALPLGELLALPMIALIASCYGRRKGLSQMLLLDERDRKEGKVIAFSVNHAVEDILLASQKISDFCDANDLDPQRALLVSLSLEELLLLIGEHAFGVGGAGSMDIRLFAVGEEVLLRIRNGGALFDPIHFFETHPDDMEQCLGIQMIISSAREVRYTQTLGVNNVTVLL